MYLKNRFVCQILTGILCRGVFGSGFRRSGRLCRINDSRKILKSYAIFTDSGGTIPVPGYNLLRPDIFK
jgi:hypothetical protein